MKTILTFKNQIEDKYDINCGICDMDKTMFHAELRKACEVNSCGNYGKCHTCPPNIGSAEECIERVSSYSKVIVYQKIYPLEDSYDYYGMVEAQKEFNDVIHGVADIARITFKEPLILGAGGCFLCETCAAKDGKPCRYPDKAVQSLEANCIQVSELSALAGMRYINGQNTVTYFGAVLLRKADE